MVVVFGRTAVDAGWVGHDRYSRAGRERSLVRAVEHGVSMAVADLRPRQHGGQEKGEEGEVQDRHFGLIFLLRSMLELFVLDWISGWFCSVA